MVWKKPTVCIRLGRTRSVLMAGRACRSALFSWVVIVSSKSGISRLLPLLCTDVRYTHPVLIKQTGVVLFEGATNTRVGLKLGTTAPKKMTPNVCLGCKPPPPIDSQKRATFTIPSEINRHNSPQLRKGTTFHHRSKQHK